MKKNVILLLSMLICLFLYNCDKQVGLIEKPEALKPDACDTVTYNKHIQPIFALSCGLNNSSCHSSTGSGGDFTTYAQVKAIGENGKLKARAFDGVPNIMPLGGPKLAQNQLDLIQCWINNNYKQQ